MAARDEVLADRLKAEPAIFRGCSSSELGAIVAAAALFWLPVSLVLAGLVGALTMGFGVAGAGVVASVVVLASLLQRLKRNRPEGCCQQHLVVWLHERGLRRAALVRRSGIWDVGRSGDAPLPPRDR